MFRFDYSVDFLRWALNPPGFYPEWIIGVRVIKSKALVGFISGVPVHVQVRFLFSLLISAFRLEKRKLKWPKLTSCVFIKKSVLIGLLQFLSKKSLDESTSKICGKLYQLPFFLPYSLLDLHGRSSPSYSYCSGTLFPQKSQPEKAH